MDDDLFGLLVGIALLGLVGYLIYLFIMYVLPSLLIVTLPGWSLYQVLSSRRFQLAKRSAACLFILGLPVAWILTVALVSVTDLHPAMALPVGAMFFFLYGLVLVIVWGTYRWLIVCWQVRTLAGAEENARSRVLSLTEQVRSYETAAARLSQEMTETSRRLEDLETSIERLCAQEARILGVIRRSAEAEVRQRSTEELSRAALLDNRSPASARELLEALTRQCELCRRRDLELGKQCEACQASTADARRELERAQTELERVRKRLAAGRAAHAKFLSNPIVL